MNSLIDECKKKGVYADKPSPEDINKMYRAVSGSLISLNENPRAENLSWHTYIRYLSLSKKKIEKLKLLM